jgi:chromatin assembly factor 1 subunit B
LPGVSHSATSSFSSTVLGKRDIGAASESEKEEAKRETVDTEKPAKKRRIAPTLVSKDSASFASEQAEKKPEPTPSSEKTEPAPPAEKVEAEKADQAAAQ